jgi:sugar lactone lactonase YvrE
VDLGDATPMPELPGIVAWRASDGFARPAAAYHDDGSRFVYVANAGGFISRLAPDGKIANPRWVGGLTNPAGMRSFKGTLYVACGDHLVAIDLARAEVTARVPVAGATGLFAVATDAGGTVYAADPAAGQIFAYDGRAVTTFAEGGDLEHPNGLLVIGNQLFVAGAGTSAAPGRVFALNLKTRQKTLVTPHPVGNLTGLERDERCNFLVGDQAAGRVYLISPRGEVTQLLAGLLGAAGPGIIPDRRLLLLPRPADNALTAYDLTKIKK